MNLFKTIGSWLLSLLGSAPASDPPAEKTPMPTVADPGWEQAKAEAEAEIARRRRQLENEGAPKG